MPDVAVLDVLLHGEAIGTLTQLGGDRNLFAFTDTYINDPERKTLSLSFKDAQGELITEIRPTQTRVAPFFSNLLPEGPLREYLAQRAGVNAKREFFLLWVLGQDLPGAIEIQPADGEAWPPDHSRGDDVRSLPADRAPLRFSLAGVQLKFSAIMESSGGLTIPADGVGGSWIVKLPSTRFDGVPENEYSMMSLASELGINVPEIRLHRIEEIEGLPSGIGHLQGSALAIKRFDRSSEGTVHIEDFAQVFRVYPQRKYERASYGNIARVIWAEIGEDAISEYVRRLVFNALIGNGDMHLKNWSLIYPDGRNASLAPAYDFVSTIVFIPEDAMALRLGRSKSWNDLSIDQLRYFAGRAMLPEKVVLDAARELVDRFQEVWRRDCAHLPLTKDTIATIEKHIRQIPLVSETAR